MTNPVPMHPAFRRKVRRKPTGDSKTAAGYIKWQAYKQDVPHQELADALQCTKANITKMLTTATRSLTAYALNVFCSHLAFTQEQTEYVHKLAAKEAGYNIGEIIKPKVVK